jgi:hypothetical protein
VEFVAANTPEAQTPPPSAGAPSSMVSPHPVPPPLALLLSKVDPLIASVLVE